ncbi:MAG: PIG-L deacetylase family protein [Candidatus Coatesbacteria bacterium]
MNILAIGCHPDDNELLCAGTLARCAKRGDRVFIASIMNGNTGHRTIPPGKLGPVREREMRAAAKCIGARPLWPDVGGAFLLEDEATRTVVVDLIREAKADVVLAHSPACYHPNHRAAARLVWDAVFTASIPHVRTRHPAVRVPPALFQMDTVAGVDFQPTEYVDISTVIGVKKRALRCHRSQFAWMRSHVNVAMLDTMLVQARFRGIQAGVAYAEGFRAVLNHPLARTVRLLP